MLPLGFLVMIPFVGMAEEVDWRGFLQPALYKATKSVIACAVYHAFMDAIGAVFDWNLLFDAFPGNAIKSIYRVLWLVLSVALWLWED